MITVRLANDDGSVNRTEECDSRDVMQWELKDHKRSINLFRESPRFTDFYEVAWHMAKRKGIVPRDLPLAEFMADWIIEIPTQDPDEESEDGPKSTGPEASDTP